MAPQAPLLHINHIEGSLLDISTVYGCFATFESLRYLKFSVSAAEFEEDDFFILKGCLRETLLDIGMIPATGL
ncbi:hypothetical protein TWF481_006230 [Arthrobotrys musiformis]|uniref:Uncharacterized protein n=1 Tax=Arthrobotrys musiformis TaxID=47236 RepID=A0AAV9WLT4_9PEZI